MDRVKQRLDVGPEIDYFGLYIPDQTPTVRDAGPELATPMPRHVAPLDSDVWAPV
jgi:hypothetical protein